MVTMPPTSRRHPSHAVRARDAGLRKVKVATRVLVVGSVAAAGAFASMAAWAQPGRSKATPAPDPTARQSLNGWSPGTTGSTATVPVTTPQSESVQGGGDDDLAPPATVPATVPAYQDPAYQDPGYQNAPPSYQYTPPVVVSSPS